MVLSPTSRFTRSQFELRAPVLKPIFGVFDFLGSSQEDAQGSISPLWVRIKGVWALGGFVVAVLGIFGFLEKLIRKR